jgi:hypothetical protein
VVHLKLPFKFLRGSLTNTAIRIRIGIGPVDRIVGELFDGRLLEARCSYISPASLKGSIYHCERIDQTRSTSAT